MRHGSSPGDVCYFCEVQLYFPPHDACLLGQDSTKSFFCCQMLVRFRAAYQAAVPQTSRDMYASYSEDIEPIPENSGKFR